MVTPIPSSPWDDHAQDSHDHPHHDHAHDEHDHEHDHDTITPIRRTARRARYTTSFAAIRMGPTPDQLAGPGGWTRGLMAIFAVGLRRAPARSSCWSLRLRRASSGRESPQPFVMGIGTAITVATIATLTVSATGLAARIAATRTGYGSLALRRRSRGAAVVLIFGVALLAGYMASERMVGIAEVLERVDAETLNTLLHRGRRPGGMMLGFSARACRHRRDGVGEARRFPARLPPAHVPSLTLG